MNKNIYSLLFVFIIVSVSQLYSQNSVKIGIFNNGVGGVDAKELENQEKNSKHYHYSVKLLCDNKFYEELELVSENEGGKDEAIHRAEETIKKTWHVKNCEVDNVWKHDTPQD